jgi:hypothetical protein
MRRSPLPSVASSLALLSFLACGGARQETPVPGPARPAAATSHVLTATCRSVSDDGRRLDVITGLSFSLRVVTFRLDENTEVKLHEHRGAEHHLGPGMVVRIHYRKTPQGNEADRIETVLDSTETR